MNDPSLTDLQRLIVEDRRKECALALRLAAHLLDDAKVTAGVNGKDGEAIQSAVNKCGAMAEDVEKMGQPKAPVEMSERGPEEAVREKIVAGVPLRAGDAS